MVQLKLNLTPNEAGIYIFKPGDALKGFVELINNGNKKCSSLKLEIVGRVITQTYNESSKFKGKNLIFCKEIKFFDRFSPPHTLSNRHQYDFEFELPTILPYSLKVDLENKIEYFAKAILLMSKKSQNIEQRKDFKIFIEYDLNLNLLNFIGQHCEGVLETCRFFCEKGSIKFSSSIPYTGFVEGQIIPVTIKYVNQSNVQIYEVIINLVQIIEIKCKTSDSEATDYINIITTKKFPDKDLRQTVFGFIKASDELKIFITVPFGIYLSNSHVCDLIKVKYFLDVTMVTNSYRHNAELRMPIEIGTKRIRPIRDVGNHSFDNNNLYELGILNPYVENLNHNSDRVRPYDSNSTNNPPNYDDILPSYEEVVSPKNTEVTSENHKM